LRIVKLSELQSVVMPARSGSPSAVRTSFGLATARCGNFPRGAAVAALLYRVAPLGNELIDIEHLAHSSIL
jgi:hypothetical protein